PFWARLELLARLTLNAGKHAGNQPARVAQLDHGNDRAILVQGDEGSAQIVWLGHRGTPSVRCSDEVAMPRRPPHSVYQFRSCERPLLSVANRGRRHEKAEPPAGTGPKRQCLPTAFPFAEGPRVRFRFRQRRVCELSVSATWGVKGTAGEQSIVTDAVKPL